MGYSDSAFPYKITPEFRKHQKRVFFITVLLYCSFHSSRTAWAYVKVSVTEDSYYTDKMIGIFDMCFMIAYASGLFISGWIGDRSNLKNFLAIGAIISVAGFITFSTAANTVHSVIFGSFCFLLNGFGQSRGFPGNMSLLGNWFEPRVIGIVVGCWTAGINVGNIAGYQFGRLIINDLGIHWRYALYISGACMVIMAAMLFFFLKSNPNSAGFQEDVQEIELQERFSNYMNDKHDPEEGNADNGITFKEALKLKGTIICAISYACIKGSTYGLLFWLPNYLQTVIGFGSETAYISASYEFGQLCGSIILGIWSDKLGKRSIAGVSGLFVSCILFYHISGLGPGTSVLHFCFVMYLSGFCFGGPEIIIGHAVVIDIGQQAMYTHGKRATATVGGIIDGTGSIGAALVQILIPYIKSQSFYLYFSLALIGGLVLLPMAIRDIKEIRNSGYNIKIRKDEYLLKEINKSDARPF